MSKLQIQTIAKITLLFLIVVIQSCKTTENTNPANTCRLSKYIVNTYTDSPDYIHEMKYNNDGNLIIHKINNSYLVSQPISILGITGEKDSIIHKNKEIYKLYHFSNRFLRWDLDSEREYFLTGGKIIRTVTKNIKIDNEIQYQFVQFVVFDNYYYNTNGQLKTKISYQKRLLYPQGTPPNTKTVPLDSSLISRDTTFYTFENNNLIKKENHFHPIPPYSFEDRKNITTEYSSYDTKINPFYNLAIETNNFTNFSINNFGNRKEITVLFYDTQSYKLEKGFTQSFSYDLKGYPIDINNSNKLSVIIKKDLPYYVYECK